MASGGAKKKKEMVKKKVKKKKAKEATSNLWSVDWSAGGPSLASTEKKLPPLPKIVDQGEAEIHATSHAHRASHVPHRQSEDHAGLTGRTQGSLLAPPPPRMSMGMDNAGVAKKMSRNLDLPLDESQSRKSSKSLDQPIDGDPKRQKHSFGVIAAKDRKLLH